MPITSLGRGGLFLLLRLALRRGLGLNLAESDELDNDPIRGITDAPFGSLHDAGITALAILEVGTHFLEELLHDGVIGEHFLVVRIGHETIREAGNTDAAGVEGALARLRDDRLDEADEFLRLGKGRLDLAVLDERLGHVSEDRFAVRRCHGQPTTDNSVTHKSPFRF